MGGERKPSGLTVRPNGLWEGESRREKRLRILCAMPVREEVAQARVAAAKARRCTGWTFWGLNKSS